MAYYVYLLASRPRGTLYVGVTGDLVRRVEYGCDAVPGLQRRFRPRLVTWSIIVGPRQHLSAALLLAYVCVGVLDVGHKHIPKHGQLYVFLA